VHGSILTSLQYRESDAGQTAQVEISSFHPTQIMLERKGNLFTFFAATFGEPYKSVSKEIALNDEVYAGLFLCSHDETVKEKAVFSNVRIVIPPAANYTPYRDYIGSHLEVMDIQTGEFQFSVPMKGFEFRKALMQEHFNENYIESDKYPKSDFKGLIVNGGEIDFKKNGTYNAKAQGKLTIHGVTNDVEAEGKIIVNETKLTLSTVFNVSLQDYKIKNDKMNNISNNIKVTVDCVLEPLP